MKIRILDKSTYKKNRITSNGLTELFNDGNYCIDSSSDYIATENAGRKLFCFGKCSVIRGNSAGMTDSLSGEEILDHLININESAKMLECIQGRFVLILIKDEKIEIMQDEFSRADIYYMARGEGIAVATDLSLLQIDKKSAGYNQEAIAHMLTYYGNRPAKKQTIYNNINRLGVSETIVLDRNEMNVNKVGFQPKQTRKYTKKDNDIYCDLFLQLLEQEGSKEGNLVYLSSGWDSTSILAGLVHVFGANKVSVLTGRMKYSKRSGICNAIELDKVDKFTGYYKVKHEVVDFDYADKGIEMIESAMPVLKNHGYYNITAINHSVLANSAKKIIGDSNQVIFAGEISDGVHNFGFSQYATIFHPSYGFREYADKMASYLFGPTFLKRIIDGDYKEDPIYKLLYSAPGFIVDKARSSEEAIKKQLLIDFFLRNGRRPFWSSDNIKMLTEDGKKKYTDLHCKQYLADTENINYSNMYSYYIYLYNNFHWQGSTVAPLQVMAAEHGLRSCLPFWDKHIQEFLSVMPEEWGRGLDLNNTKYPLKWMLANRLDYPMELQEGPHSYTYDIDHSFNHYEEILYHSALSTDVKKVLKGFDFSKILSPEVFNMRYVDRLKSSYLLDEKLSGPELNEIASLYFLSKLD